MTKKIKKVPVRLSASRIKNLQECSYYYYGSYHLKLPDKSNDGAKRGVVCHDLFELLIKPKWIHLVGPLVESGNIDDFPLIVRFIRAKARQYKLDLFVVDKKAKKTNIGLVYEMINVGLNADFLLKDDEELIDSEYYFDITDEKLNFRVCGYIDKLLFNKVTKQLEIKDYKTSQKQFKGEDLETNLQAMIYSLASHYLKDSKKLPNFNKVIAQFIFLRFASNPFQTLEFTSDQLDGFKHYLSYISEIITNFTESDAFADYAADDPKRAWKCGAGATWVCPYKKPFNYFHLIDKNGTVKKSLFEDNFKEESSNIKLEDGDSWKSRTYNGCPRWNFTVSEHDDFL